MDYLVRKVEVATGKEVLDLIHQSDTDIPASDLPCTIATAFVDANYPNIAPYFSDYAHGTDWVQAQIIAGASKGNIIITSDQTDCTLFNNVNIWLAPNVIVDSLSGDTVHNIYIDGYGCITALTLTGCSAIDVTARKLDSIRLTSCDTVKLSYNDSQSLSFEMSNGVDIICKGTGGSVLIDAESRVNLQGENSLFSSMSIKNNSSFRAKGCRVVGLTTNGIACFSDFQDCEFYRENGIPLESTGEISLTNCWIYSGDNYGMKINEGLSTPATTIINNTMIWAGGAYAIYDASTSSTSAPLHVYGESCSNRVPYHCNAVVRSLYQNGAFKYKVY